MIFVITGTEAFPFNRLIMELDRLKENKIIDQPVHIQLGSCTYIPKNCSWEQWLPFDKMCENIKNSDMVIAHAGAGTTLLCLDLGKTPIIVTRQKKYSEHLDDHQIAFARMMENLGYVQAAYDITELENCVNLLLTDNTFKNNNFKKDNTQIVDYLNYWLNH